MLGRFAVKQLAVNSREFKPAPPFSPGGEVAGVLEAVGDDRPASGYRESCPDTLLAVSASRVVHPFRRTCSPVWCRSGVH